MICCKKLRQATQKHKEKNFKKNNKKLLKTINKGIKEKARKGLYFYTARTDRPFSLEERELLKKYYRGLGYQSHWYNENEFTIHWW